MTRQIAAERSASSRGPLPKAALNLLEALAEEGGQAVPDPSREDFILLRGRLRGMSVGRGSRPRAALDMLLALGLAERPGGGPAVTISADGRSRLRRERLRRREGDEDSFTGQHREIEPVELAEGEGTHTALANLRESPLAWLRRRRGRDGEPLIDAVAYEAGERLRRDLTFAGLLPGVTARWEGAAGGGGAAPRDPAGAADTVVAARQRARAALDAVGGDFAGLLIDLCGFLTGLEEIERARRWPPRSGKIVVGLALAQLARHYGLESEARGRSASRGIAVWIAEAAA